MEQDRHRIDRIEEGKTKRMGMGRIETDIRTNRTETEWQDKEGTDRNEQDKVGQINIKQEFKAIYMDGQETNRQE